MRFEFEQRNNLTYNLYNHSKGDFINMARCGECGKKFKIEKLPSICPSCKTEITEDNTFKMEEKWGIYNSSSMIFVDGDIVTISLMMLVVGIRTFAGEYWPRVVSSRILKVKFDTRKRTALVFEKHSKGNCENLIINSDRTFVNFTQPTDRVHFSRKSNIDITLPEELIRKFLSIIEVDTSEIENLKDLTLKDLAWLNRVRDVKESFRWKEILSTLTADYDDRRYMEREGMEEVAKNINRVKRYLKTGHKPKGYDENIFNALLKSYRINRDDIPKEFERHYYQNPWGLGYVKYHNYLFTNYDVRVNAIKANFNNRGRRYIGLYNYQQNNSFNFGRDDVVNVFGGEVNVQKKLKSDLDYRYMYDTVRMLLEIKKEGHKVKTKGSMKEVHDRASKKMKYISVPDIIFENTKDREDEVQVYKKNKYTFVYAKSPIELVEIGDIMDICVGSYYRRCSHHGTVIVYLKKDNNILACLEIQEGDWNNVLYQAKGYRNSKLNTEAQKVIVEFCTRNNISIKTHDINKSLADKNNAIVSTSNSLNEPYNALETLLA